MKTLKIEINGAAFVLFFGYKTFKLLAELWQLPGYQAVLNKISEIGAITDEISFDQFEVLGDVVLCAIKANALEQPEVNRDDLMDHLVCNIKTTVVDVVNGLVSAVVKPSDPEAPGKTVPAKKL